MSVNKYYAAALEKLQAKRKGEIALYEAQKAKAYEENPRLKEIDFEISANGAGLALAALSGNTAKANQRKMVQRYADLLDDL